MKRYYVIQCSDDGDVSLMFMTETELKRKLNHEEIDATLAEIPPDAIHDLASGSWPLIIIEGEAIMPIATAKQVVEWEV